MALAAYTKTCGKNVSGNFHKVFLTEVANLTSVTLTDLEISAVTMNGSTYFQMLVGEIDSVQFKSEGNGGPNYFETQTLTIKFAKASKEVNAVIEAITDAVTCGIVAIRVDGNGKAWMSGHDYNAVDKKARPYNQVKVTYDSGLKPSDAEGNIVTVELTRESEWDELPFTDTVSGYIAALDSGNAAFIAVT